MATLKSKKLQEALKKAKNVGRAEEQIVVDECSLVLQSLNATQYEAIVAEVKDVDGIEYFHSYQAGHVCRAIVEIEGIDLRETEYVETEVPSGGYLINAVVSKTKAAEAKGALQAIGVDLTVVTPDGSEGERTVLVERHEWVRQQISTWSREAVTTTYRKLTDVITEGERRARSKIEFRVSDESAEDKFRRLLMEAKGLENEIPPDLVQSVLEDIGYLQKSTPQELAEIDRRAREFAMQQAEARQQQAQAEAPPPPRDPAPMAAPEPPKVEEGPPPSPIQVQQDLQAELAERLKARVPMNRQPMQAPVPLQPGQVPTQLQANRASQIAALEGQLDPEALAQPAPFPLQQVEVAELSKPAPRLDGGGLKSILNQPPTVGLNPRFRRQ